MNIELYKKDYSSITQFGAEEFLELVVELLENFGWLVKLPSPNRYDSYLLGITKDKSGLDISWLIKCQKNNGSYKVGIQEIMNLYEVKKQLGVSNALYVTNTGYTESAESFAGLRYDLYLIDKFILQKWLAEYQPSTDSSASFMSCFISHSSADAEFAKKLTIRLRKEGIKTWYAPEDLIAGRKIFSSINKAIFSYDKLILILSKNSIKSKWVETEIRFARQREIKEGKNILFPISLLPFEKLRNWQCFNVDTGEDLAVKIREFYIPYFDDWTNQSSFETSMKEVIKGLKNNA